jgi:hypothetical protein
MLKFSLMASRGHFSELVIEPTQPLDFVLRLEY